MGDWELGFPDKSPLLIAGPCSAETREQVLSSANASAAAGAHMIRAGIWKPRTRPGTFSGLGEPALKWLVEARSITGLPICVEVATPAHIESALAHNVDVLWIGARTTVSPFSVQELAEALSGTDVPVMVKNPVNPDLDLWIGALERFGTAGISKLAAVHRGFSVYKSAPYRNAPMWQIPIELQRRLPDMPIICDPSHICGKRDLIPDIAQIAYDLDFDGLMLEVHPDPDNALSDARQQLDPHQLRSLMNELQSRASKISDPEFAIALEQYRSQIDGLDNQIIDLLADRMRISKQIGRLKHEQGVTVFQLDRWSRIFDSRVADTISAGLSESFARQFMQCLHAESIRQQLEK